MKMCILLSDPIEEYKLPFEIELGSQPTLEDLKKLVVQDKARPKIKEAWRKHLVLIVRVMYYLYGIII